jgi:3-oxoacyl-[acyl-carrier-protein] synthase-1
MTAQPIAIKSTGLVTSVGLSAPASCAAIRAKISNPTETRFMGSDGEWIMAHQVPLAEPWRGSTKLAKMAAMAIVECLQTQPRKAWPSIPLLLCVAERARPGRHNDLEDQLLLELEQELGVQFAVGSAVIPYGRVGAAMALAEARKLIYGERVPQVLIAAGDSLLTWPTLSVYERADRLLTPGNSNGFMPGEGAGAALIARPIGPGELRCLGIGVGAEHAYLDSGEPLRGVGLASAICGALAEAGMQFHDLDYRITDISGEQYYFKEAALALSRLLRRRKENFDLWHPAECIGEAGAAAGMTVLAVADAACRKAYSAGPNILAHCAIDSGRRAAMILQWSGI